MQASIVDPEIKAHATPRQSEIIDAVNAQGSRRGAARVLGVNESTVRKCVKAAEESAATKGYAPRSDVNSEAPPGFSIYKLTQQRDGEGGLTQQWTKFDKDKADRLEALREAVKEIADEYRGVVPPVQPRLRSQRNADLLTVYPMGDPHMGMFAWAAEAGQDFDLKIAERNLVGAVDQLVGLAPPTRDALIINLGDFFHSDNASNRTSNAGNALDVDTRWPKILRAGIRAMCRCIDKALEKHRNVEVINAIGNHDDHTSIMLSVVLDAMYSENKRVWIDTSPTAFHYKRFGKVLIGVTHGHRAKGFSLGPIMATDRKADWGETDHRYWYCGHVHHDAIKEIVGCKIETFRTLAASDAWHTGQGYRSGRDMKCIVHHKDHGEVLRHTVGVGML